MTAKETIRQRLKETIKERGLSINDIAKLVPSEKNFESFRVRIYQYVRGFNTLSLDAVEKIFNALGLELTIQIHENYTCNNTEN